MMAILLLLAVLHWWEQDAVGDCEADISMNKIEGYLFKKGKALCLCIM